jgi:hypothetical protein
MNVQEMMDNVRAYLRITQARPTVVRTIFANATSDTQPDETCHQFSARSNMLSGCARLSSHSAATRRPDDVRIFPLPGTVNLRLAAKSNLDGFVHIG